MPQNIRSRLLDRPRPFVPVRLRDAVAQSLRETRDNRRVVSREVVQLDRLRDAIALFRLSRGGDEDMLVVLPRIVQLEQRRTLLNRSALTTTTTTAKIVPPVSEQVPRGGHECGRGERLTNRVPSGRNPPTSSSQAAPGLARTMMRRTWSQVLSTCSLPTPPLWSAHSVMQ